METRQCLMNSFDAKCSMRNSILMHFVIIKEIHICSLQVIKYLKIIKTRYIFLTCTEEHFF